MDIFLMVGVREVYISIKSVLFLMYHYFAATEIYNAIRIFIAAYVWMKTRTVLKIDKNNPGTDVATETAAALVAASLVFRTTDRTYSKLLVSRAKRVFAFADKYRGAYSNGLESYVCPFYCDYSGFQLYVWIAMVLNFWMVGLWIFILDGILCI